MMIKRIAVLLMLSAVLLLAACRAPQMNVTGSLDSFEIDRVYKDIFHNFSRHDAEECFHMTDSVWEDVADHPKDYAVCWVGLTIRNQTNHPIYAVKAGLAKRYPNLWLDTSSLCECQPLDIEQGEAYQSVVCIVILCDGRSDDELGKVIQGVKVNISYSSHSLDETGISFLQSAMRQNTVLEFNNK